MTNKMNAEQMADLMNNMENGERILFLEYLFHNYFDMRPTGDMVVTTTNYIEDRLDRELTAEELEVMKLAYDTGYGLGCKHGLEKALKSGN